jgi:L-threonylcarbamoyladenylate synthase
VPVRLRKAVRALLSGGVIAYPTEAVFGLGCLPDKPTAIERIIHLKGRSPSAGFILIGESLAQLEPWIAPSGRERARLRAGSADPITWVVTASPAAPASLTGGRKTIAIRVTSHPVARALCAAAGSPLISTSANRRGRRPARSALGVRSRFRGAVDAVAAGAVGPLKRPTEIREAATGRVLRRG